MPDHVPVTTIEEDELAGEYGRSMPVTSNSTYAYETGHQFGEIFNDTLNDTRNAAMIGGSMIPVVGPVLEGVNAIVDSSQGNYYQAATNIAIAGIASRLGGKKPCPGQYRSFTANNFRENLIRLTGTNPGSATHAHHVFPIKLQRIFNRPEINININEPIYGAWWGQGSHLGKVTEYNNEWEVFFENTRSRDEVINFARKLSRDYGFKLYF